MRKRLRRTRNHHQPARAIRSRDGVMPMWLTSVAVLVLASWPTLTSAQGLADHPVIEVEPEFLDFGIMEQHQSATREITIHNVGTQTLHIHEVRSDCGCTVVELATEALEPGAFTKLVVNFDSKSFEGPQTKHLRIYSNDPANSTLEYAILADVHVPVFVTPKKKQLGFGKVRQGLVDEQRASFRSEDVPELVIEPVSYNEEVFDIDVQPRWEGNPERVVLIARTKPTAPLGLHREFIRVRTNVPEMPTIDLEVFVEIVQDLAVDPKIVNFRYAQRNKRLSSKVRVRPTVPGVTYKITGAEIDLPEFNAVVEEVRPNQETQITITGYPLATSDPRAVEAEGRLAGTLRIFTDLPQQPELLVRVIYLLKM